MKACHGETVQKTKLVVTLLVLGIFLATPSLVLGVHAGAATAVVCTPNALGGLTCTATDPGGIASIEVRSVTAPPVVELDMHFQRCVGTFTFSIDALHNHLIFIEEWADRMMGHFRVFLVDTTGAVVPFP